nr:hypothetical protein [Myxococcota bacterium]
MREISRVGATIALACALLVGCSLDRLALEGGDPGLDAGRDAGRIDGGRVDAGEIDAGEIDGALDAEIDGGEIDGGEIDGGEIDGGEVDGGEVDGGPPCVTGERSCAGADLVECAAGGALVVIETCALGCLGTIAPPRCGRVRATHVDDPDRLFDGTADLVVAAGENVEIDTSTGRIIDTSTGTERRAAGAAGDASGLVLVNVAQSAGFPELAILSVGALRVETGGTLAASGSRALIVLASSAITIDGTIDVGGRGRAGGP